MFATLCNQILLRQGRQYTRSLEWALSKLPPSALILGSSKNQSFWKEPALFIFFQTCPKHQRKQEWKRHHENTWKDSFQSVPLRKCWLGHWRPEVFAWESYSLLSQYKQRGVAGGRLSVLHQALIGKNSVKNYLGVQFVTGSRRPSHRSWWNALGFGMYKPEWLSPFLRSSSGSEATHTHRKNTLN